MKTNHAAGGLQAARHVDAERNPPLPVYASRLARDLGRAVAGEVAFGAQARALYAFDASVFRQVPIGVVVPRDAADVEAALACCREHGAPVLGRGCGTGLAGQTVNQAVVFDFSRYMNAIVELDPRRRQARVQPGVICDELKDAAEPHRLTFGPDPATHDHATLGGMIGNNSCGTHSVLAALYGPGPRTSDNVDELDILTYDGLRLRVGATSEEDLAGIIAAGGRRAEIYAGLRAHRRHLRRRDPAPACRTSRAGCPATTWTSCCRRRASTWPGPWSAAREPARWCWRRRPAWCTHRPSAAWSCSGYPDIPSSGDDVPCLMGFEPIGCEFTSRHVVDNLHAKGFDFDGEDRLPPGDAWVLLEFGGDTKAEADARAEELFRQLERRLGRAESPAVREPGGREPRSGRSAATRPAPPGCRSAWAATAAGRTGRTPPYRPTGSAATCATTRPCWTGTDTTASSTGTGARAACTAASTGTSAPPKDVRNYRRFMEEAADLVVSYGGSLSGEHGDGHGAGRAVAARCSARS